MASRLALVGLAALVLATGIGTAVASGAGGAPVQPRLPRGATYFDAGPAQSVDRARLMAATPAWRGGPIVTPTGETVVVRISDSLPAEVTPEYWAQFLSGLVHGNELPLLTLFVASLDEVQTACGDRALGCYGGNQMIVPGATTPDGTTPEEIVRHEYGHHIAYNRVNPPWVAVDWGPKNWASSESVCAKAGRQEAYPGDEGTNYALNPGEAWAETYRLLDERQNGITTGTWPIIAPSFYPADAQLAAAEKDVLQPWTTTTTTSYTHRFPKKAKAAWWVPLAMPLDGDFKLTVVLPPGSEATVALVGPNRTTVVGRAQWVGQRSKRLTTTICGQRSGFVRVTPSGAAGLVRMTVTKP